MYVCMYDERVSAKLRVTEKSAYESSLIQKIAYIYIQYIYIYIYLAGFSKRLSTVTGPVSRVLPPLPPKLSSPKLS